MFKKKSWNLNRDRYGNLILDIHKKIEMTHMKLLEIHLLKKKTL